eukprot:262348_1
MDEEKGAVSEHLIDDDAPPKREGGLCAPWKWFCESPIQRYQFLIFLLFGGLTVVWLLMFVGSAGSATAYILAGIAAIIMSGYGANHFRILLGLKEQVDKMANLNQQFRKENAALQQEVDKLERAREQLCSVESGLKESNKKLKENVEKFRQLDKNLKQLADSNIEGLEKLQRSSEKVMKTMEESLERHEKEILHKVFEHLEWSDKEEGLDRKEFARFWEQMPTSYMERWKRSGKTFEDYAGQDELLQFDEFSQLCDEFAVEEAKAGGSTDL